MKRSRTYPLFLMIRALVKLIYPKMKVEGKENLPKEPCIIVANHAQMNGPIACELYSPVKRYTWCAGQMMHLKEVPGYAFQDFWSWKPRRTHWFYKLLSYLIAPLAVIIFNGANTIPVYRDKRVMDTFRQTIKRLEEGASIVIFPEHDPAQNHILSVFQEGFVDVANLYFRRTGREISFAPMYIAPNMHKMVIGKPVKFQSGNASEKERKRICAYLFNEITKIAVSLPQHTVVPYRNIPKKQYPKNK